MHPLALPTFLAWLNNTTVKTDEQQHWFVHICSKWFMSSCWSCWSCCFNWNKNTLILFDLSIALEVQHVFSAVDGALNPHYEGLVRLVAGRRDQGRGTEDGNIGPLWVDIHNIPEHSYCISHYYLYLRFFARLSTFEIWSLKIELLELGRSWGSETARASASKQRGSTKRGSRRSSGGWSKHVVC